MPIGRDKPGSLAAKIGWGKKPKKKKKVHKQMGAMAKKAAKAKKKKSIAQQINWGGKY